MRDGDRRVLAGGGPLMDVEETRTRPGGDRRTLLTSRVPLRDAVGGVLGILGVYQDSTRRKQLEERVRHTQKREPVGQLAGGIAHDFSNLLTVIGGDARLLEPAVTATGSYAAGRPSGTSGPRPAGPPRWSASS